MKNLTLGFLIAFTTLTTKESYAVEVIDSKTVYAADLNICVASFGGLIQTSEIVIAPQAKVRMLKSKQLLQRWIHNYDYSGFYLKDYDSSQFYWQFVETKKYIGAILIVTGDTIHNEFYSSLGGGLNVAGKKFYGLRMPDSLNGDVYSFVINKQYLQLDHFENWRFTEDSDEPIEIGKLQRRQLLTRQELNELNLMVRHKTALISKL